MNDRVQLWAALAIVLGAAVLTVAHVSEGRWVWAVATAFVVVWAAHTARTTWRRS